MTPHPARGPVRPAERALAPDLARGSMLLLIALANALGVVFAGAPGVDPAAHGPARVTNLVMFTLVHARTYPVFAVMFGYGLVQLARRQRAAGATPRAARAVLVRRNAWLVGFGAAHGLLLYPGDFLGAYGLVGIAMAVVLLPRGERVQRLALWLWVLSALEALVLATLLAVSWRPGSAGVPVATSPALAAPSYLAALRDRLTEWPAHTASVLPFLLIVWLGSWAARRRILEQPDRHLRLLRGTAAAGLAVAVLGGLPLALLSAGLVRVDEHTAELMSLLHGVSGMFAGPGFVALFGLLTRRLAGAPPGPALRALAALGRRSLSGYLFQSVAWLVLLAPYTLALGRVYDPTLTAVVVAGAVWVVSVLAARRLERLGQAGPAEWLLRRLTYGRGRAQLQLPT